MKKNILTVLVVALTLVLGFAVIASADTGPRNDFNAQYPGNSYGSNICSVCHTSPPALNPYGADLKANGGSNTTIPAATFVAVEGLDSDGDGFTNIVEITHKPSTFPGNASSFPAPPVVTVTAPNGGEVIDAGPTTPPTPPPTITYDYDPAKVTSVKVKYSIDGGLTWLTAVDAGGSVLGSFNWNVPTLLKNTTKAFVKVIGYNATVKVGSDRSDKPFTIDVVSITTPTANVSGGIPYPVEWTWSVNGTKGTVSDAQVFYTFGSSGIWKRVGGTAVLDTVLGTGSLSWNVPSVAKAKKAKLKVVLKDAGVTVGKAVSEVFIIVP